MLSPVAVALPGRCARARTLRRLHANAPDESPTFHRFGRPVAVRAASALHSGHTPPRMKLLFVGGTGNISTSCSRLALELGHELWLLHRPGRPGIAGARDLHCDIADEAAAADAAAGSAAIGAAGCSGSPGRPRLPRATGPPLPDSGATEPRAPGALPEGFPTAQPGDHPSSPCGGRSR